MVDFDITKIQKICETNSSMAHNFYFLICGKIYNKNKTKTKEFKYVECVDPFEVMDFFEEDYYNDELVEEYVYNLENVYLSNVKSYSDKQGLKEFYDFCDRSMEDYNKIMEHDYYGIF